MSRDLVRACAIGRAATLRRGPGPAGVRADGLFSPAGWDTPTWAQATCGGRVPTCRANACGGRPAATSVSRPASAHGLRKSGQGALPNHKNPWFEPPDHGIGRSRGGLTTKLHLVCDGRGRPLRMMIPGGNINDTTMMTAVLEDIRVPRAGKGRPRTRPDRVLADKGYPPRATRAWPSSSVSRRRRPDADGSAASTPRCPGERRPADQPEGARRPR